MNLFEKTLKQIKPIDKQIKTEVEKHLNSLTKPIGSLGKLEDVALQYALITGKVNPLLRNKRIVLFAADHEVTAEGVSAFPKEVTVQMVYNILNGGAAISVLAKHIKADLQVVDIGVDGEIQHEKLFARKVKNGTDNMATTKAMTVEEAVQALEVGIEFADKAKAEGIDLLATGEMGIGNTTAASALFAVLLPCEVEEITGRGTGIGNKTLENKVAIIKKAISTNKENLTDPLSTLAAIGGLEIAGITGLIIGAAANKIPVVVDGFISSAAALVACKINPLINDYLFYSHLSAEKGHKTFYNLFKVNPLLNLNMRLGEGSGAALALNVIEAAVKIYNEMATFESAGVSNND